MKPQQLWDWAGHTCCRAHLALLDKRNEYAASPRQRRLMTASAVLTCGGLLLATSAHAIDGIAGMVDTASVQGDSIKSSAGKLFAAMGFVSAGFGGYNWWRKGKGQLRRHQVTCGWHCALAKCRARPDHRGIIFGHHVVRNRRGSPQDDPAGQHR
jgi:hypothetical protein